MRKGNQKLNSSQTRVQGGWSVQQNQPKKQTIPTNENHLPLYVAVPKQEENIIKLQDGLVLLRNAIDIETQNYLVEKCFEIGNGTDSGGGFYSLKEGMLKLNMKTRGRIIEPIEDFPEKFKELCSHYVGIAQAVDATMPSMSPTTALINFYKEGSSFKWHKDSESPELVKMKKGKPVVSFSIGLSADFGIKRYYDDKKYQTVRLNSGDVILFGGPSRMIVHSVLHVHPNTMPVGLMMQKGRLNITLRDVEGYLDPTAFPRYRVLYDIQMNENDQQQTNDN